MLAFYLFILSCTATTAVLWYMHVVHYSTLPYINPNKWTEYMEKRRQWNIMVFYPLIAIEVLSGIAVVLIATQSTSYPFLVINLLLLGLLIAFSTIYLLPLLKKISGPDDTQNLKKFDQWSFIRCIGWSLRFILIVLILTTSA